MERDQYLADRFEEHRDHLKGVAYRMLGSLTEAEDAVQEAWLRLQRTDDGGIGNLGGWLTTAVARVSLDMLRARRAKAAEPIGEDWRMPDPLIERESELDPEHEALLADSVGLALLVVLETLTPAERLAFVLHDMFAVPFGEIADIVGRSPEASRQLASRARRRVRGSAAPDGSVRRRREVGDAFMAASRDGRFEDLLALLDPDVVLRVDDGTALRIVQGAEAVSQQAFAHSRLAEFARPAVVNGGPGGVVVQDGVAVSVVALTVADGRIVAMDILADPQRLAQLDLSEFGVQH
jgi:RNA polymerase sigma factor (sigma-70 family)